MPGGGSFPSPHEGVPALPREPLAPRQAPVTPRASVFPDGEPLPLHHHLQRLLHRGSAAAVTLVGPHGSGKTAALQHLVATLPPDSPVVLLDDDGHYWTGRGALDQDRLVVRAARAPDDNPRRDRAEVTLRMAPWTTDHLIEYLLNTHRGRCASVMGRLKQSPASDLESVPGLWSVVLDAMCDNDSLATPEEALRHLLAARLGDSYLRRLATDFSLQRVLHPDRSDPTEPPHYFLRADALLGRLIGYRGVQVILAAQRIVWDLGEGNARDHVAVPPARFPADLVREVASLASFRPPVMHALRRFALGHDRMAHASAATILHATGTGWRPEVASKPSLSGARLGGASWDGVDLGGASISAADLSRACLDRSSLDDAAAGEANLRGASLRGASLRGTRAIAANLSGADLSGADADGAYFDNADLSSADLSGAWCRGAWFNGADLGKSRLVGADLRKARLHDARLAGADLTGADFRGASLSAVDLSAVRLSGANFAGAKLHRCDLQNVEWRGATFRKADLCECDLTGSVLPGADFRRAVLRNAGLADVAWEGADLRGADFTGASFHLGSTRSGLVGSTAGYTPPCEGSRTGFYTDDYDDHSYRPPEELRKANLRSADLRGARVFGADFYLVDLRGAVYGDAQASYFRRCGAIM